MTTPQNIETEEDEYISFKSTFKTDDGTEYESWVYRTRIIKTGKYKVGGHITVSNPTMYNVRDHTTIEGINSKKLAEINTEIIKQTFKTKIYEYANADDTVLKIENEKLKKILENGEA